MSQEVYSQLTQPPAIFAGMAFVCAVQDDKDGELTLRDVVINLGGKFLGDEYQEDCTHVVCDNMSVPMAVMARRDGKELVSDCWVKICFATKGLIDPAKKPMWRPAEHTGCIPGCEGFLLNKSGYSHDSRIFVDALIKRSGIPTSEGFKKRVTHLLCYEFLGNKYNSLRSWDVAGQHAVSHLWLERCVSEWRYIPEGDQEGLFKAE
mmetsp:Transcript_16148/g.50762  ORF Transcript_16148/g.50762 Transcript_16148/m.50762 type:complete len:206 (+) Transcript_16148:279-896(+)